MKSTLVLPIALLMAVTAHAQLSPRTDAPLYSHMLEVNAEWANMDPALANDPKPVHFSNEAERIAMHLNLVDRYLRSHTPKGFSKAATKKRDGLLDELFKYADRGQFPQNNVLPYRNPVFIDGQGTACAVGQLMIESGHGVLAESISKEMNLAYVHDMKRADVLQWATQEGFTEDELAWIQPGYPPTVQWSALGGGTNGSVRVMFDLPSGSVLVAGDFTEAGGVPVQNVAMWNGSDYVALGTGVNGTITCGTALGTDIYLGGSQMGGYGDLAHWDGAQWTYSSVFDGKSPYMGALHVHNGDVYAAGSIAGFIGVDFKVAQLVGNNWNLLPGNFTGEVKCLGSHDGQLVAGGEFDGVQIGDPVLLAQHVATYGPGGWTQLADGLDGPVFALLDDQGSLYAGGSMYANIVPLFGLARLGTGADTWEQLMPNLTDYAYSGIAPAAIRALLSDGDHIYIGGDFGMTQFMVEGQNLARFQGTPDSFEPLAYFNAPVDALASNPFISDVFGLYAAGEFTENNNDTVPYIAEAILSTGIKSPPEKTAVSLYPNPAHDRLTVTLVAISDNTNLELVDAQGRIVMASSIKGISTTLDISALVPGAYMLRIAGNTRVSPQPFIKH